MTSRDGPSERFWYEFNLLPWIPTGISPGKMGEMFQSAHILSSLPLAHAGPVRTSTLNPPAAERRSKNFTGVDNVYLKAKARIGPC